MEKKQGETYLDYAFRLGEAKENGLITYGEYGDYLLRDDNCYSDDNIRKAYYVIGKLLPKIAEDINFNPDNEDIFRELEIRETELFKQTVRLRDQRREKKKIDTSEARFEYLLSIMNEAIADLPKRPQLKLGEKINLTECKNSATLSLSDWHTGAYIDNQFNFFNIDTLQKRVEELYDKVIKYTTLHKVKDLYVEVNGDMIAGIIHVSARVGAEEDVVRQVVIASDILAQLINKLKPYFESITVITTLGNHGRIVPEKTANITKENFEGIIPHFLRRDVEDIKIISSGTEDFTKYNIGDKLICVTHGHTDKLNTIVHDFTLMYNQIPTEIHSAHRHSFKDMNECDVMVMVNGSLMGTDDYALSIRKRTKPSQSLIIYGEDRCVYNLVVN